MHRYVSGLHRIRIWFTATFQDFFVFFRTLKPTFTIFFPNLFSENLRNSGETAAELKAGAAGPLRKSITKGILLLQSLGIRSKIVYSGPLWKTSNVLEGSGVVI